MRGISSLIDTDLEDSTHFLDENLILSSASESELPTKKAAQSKAADSRITKATAASQKPKTLRELVASKASGKAVTTKRKALEEQVNGEAQPANKKTCPTAAAPSDDDLRTAVTDNKAKPEVKTKPKRKAKAKKDALGPPEVSDHNAVLVQPGRQHNAVKKSRVGQKAVTAIAQPSLVELDSGADADTACSPQRPATKIVRSASRPRQENLYRRRAGSASDTDRAGGDPNLRRKLGDMTRKFENIDLKYRNLKEMGISEANVNVEKMRKQCEVTAVASAELISSLKKELATQMPLAHEARQLQVELHNSKVDATTYRSSISNLESSLAAAQNEIKALQARLAAARSAATSMESVNAKTPGSAKKNSSQVRTVMVGSPEAAQAAQTAQLKEDLYSDLTGLIIRNVKRTEDGDAYDCIQTGRNGSKCSHHDVGSSGC